MKSHDRVFKTRFFSRWMRKTELTEKALCDAVLEMIHGLIDADLGGGIIKKRVGIADRGKRGGARTVLATNKNDRWFFVFGFQKNARSNINSEEKEALKLLADDLLSMSATALDLACQKDEVQEICHENEK
ncbi:MAG: type II toxin-antitoxin system RelE/ParE family toxin [Desulfobacteraceae bacterium]|nr:type II toxin-antitoxin system RelE/ParE family toxin [Desulfobacteraceae bacterium]